jgi:hypothetical protein
MITEATIPTSSSGVINGQITCAYGKTMVESTRLATISDKNANVNLLNSRLDSRWIV